MRNPASRRRRRSDTLREWAARGLASARGVGASLAVVVLSGCSATAPAPRWLDQQARRMRPPPGYALLYVLRPAFLGKTSRFDVYVNGDWIGATGGRRYIFTVLPPGHHVIESRAENRATLRLNVRAGRTYYVQQRPSLGRLRHRNRLRVLSPARAQPRLARCRLSQAMPGHMLRLAALRGRLPPTAAPAEAGASGPKRRRDRAAPFAAPRAAPPAKAEDGPTAQPSPADPRRAP
jgi:hypothetical protein